MSLPLMDVELTEVAQIGVAVESFFVPVCDSEDTGDLTTMAIGRCYALEYSPLADEARRLATTWHRLLLETAVCSLWEEKTSRPAAVGYVPGNVIRLFIFTKQRRFLTRAHDRLSRLPGYIESGRDTAKTNSLRVIAFWHPPFSMLALWPLDLYGRPADVPSVVDTGALLGYSCYPESNHRSISVDAAGPDYVRVPCMEHDAFHCESNAYQYRNSHYRLLVRGR